MFFLVIQEVQLFVLLLVFDLAALRNPLVHRLTLDFQIQVAVFCLCFLRLQIANALLEVTLAVLRLQLLAHCESHGRLVKRLVRCDRHLDLVADAQEQQTALRLRNRNLTNNFVEALRKQFFANRANASFTRLALHQLAVKHLSQAGYVDTACLLRANVHDVVLAVLDPLAGWQNRVQNVLGGWLALDGRQGSLFLSGGCSNRHSSKTYWQSSC